MSFTKEVKEEISKVKEDNCCKLAEISALLDLGSSIYLSSDGMHLEFQTTNLNVARRFVELLKGLYEVELEIISKRREKLDKATMYIVRVVEGANMVIYENNLLDYSSSDHDEIIQKECCKKAYLRGAFLVSGSVNDPSGSYHLELSCQASDEILYIQRLMNEFNLNAKITKRRNNLICYIKEVERITDFLCLIGAQDSFFKFQEIRIKRDLNSNINRVINCEVANLAKTMIFVKEQMNDISLIESIIPSDKIDEKLKEIIDLRKENPESSMNDLVQIMASRGKKITKSGINHRFRKIHELACSLRDGK